MSSKNDNYWSDQHQALLASCAEKVIRSLRRSNNITIPDLIAEGWRVALRHRRPDQLRGCASITMHVMREYASKWTTGQSRWERTHHPTTTTRFSDLTNDQKIQLESNL